ncbi:MAG TPA: NAD-dependent epimerase/dehydratase family protein [Candidatus Atribacteria bacterium]|mgnify:FL=1|nr:NAD-dependent epimerase/dehydratase family protein [Candidatus Atribacteria bacterium]
MAKVLISGGAGFIGSHIAEAYLASGFDVVVVDNLSTGKRENLPRGVTFYEGDITSLSDMEEIFFREKPDYVNHHAAQINLRRSTEEPLFDARVNILGSISLLELSVKYRVKKFIFASTGGAIYGEVKTLPAREDMPALPLSPYGVAKRSVELYLNYYHKVQGLDFVALRYGNVYGPRQDPRGEAGVVAIFISRIIKGEPCIIFGDGRKTRDYVYIEDIARANLLALSASGIYNLGTGKETSVLDLVEVLKKVSGEDFPVVFGEERKGEIDRIALSSEKAREALGWTPSFSLEEGISHTWEWFKEAKQ